MFLSFFLVLFFVIFSFLFWFRFLVVNVAGPKGGGARHLNIENVLIFEPPIRNSNLPMFRAAMLRQKLQLHKKCTKSPKNMELTGNDKHE